MAVVRVDHSVFVAFHSFVDCVKEWLATH